MDDINKIRGKALAPNRHRYTKVGLSDKGHAIKGLVDSNSWDIRSLIPTLKV